MGENSQIFTAIPAGHYNLQITTLNAGGIEAIAPAVQIEIRDPNSQELQFLTQIEMKWRASIETLRVNMSPEERTNARKRGIFFPTRMIHLHGGDS